MESDDDYESFSPLNSSSPQVQRRRLKRLKKSITKSPDLPPTKPDGMDDLLAISRVDFAALEALEASKLKTLDLNSDDSNSSEPLLSQSSSLSHSSNNESESVAELENEAEMDSTDPNVGIDDSLFEEEHVEARTKRVLDFDGLDNEKDVEEDAVTGVEEESRELELGNIEKKRSGEGILSEEEEEDGDKKKKDSKKRRVKSDSASDLKPKSNKRREEKERRAYLQQLHAESQKLLRETRDVGFKPVPIAHKPISSVLEKIRKRKLELSKKSQISYNDFAAEQSKTSLDVTVDVDLKRLSTEEVPKTMGEETIASKVNIESCSDDSQDGYKEAAPRISCETVPTPMALDGESTPAFRRPLEDTQDLFDDPQPSDNKDELSDDQKNSPLGKDFAPSLVDMNLKFDSAPPDDCSSDEEENGKENVDPRVHTREGDHDHALLKGDPVKAFVDDEAEEEDDSDNDNLIFQENEEDESTDDLEELNDMIATEYEERPVDNERRNELHQKWLEQQDAAGTENLLQKLKYGSKHRDTTLLDEVHEDVAAEEESNDEAEDLLPVTSSRINTRKAKQIIAEMFVEKDDVFLSDEDEETEKKLVKRHRLVRAEERNKLVSPAEDETSREVFGLIKKLNIMPDNKKKAKPSSFFDTVIRGGSSVRSSKSSFLGRTSSNPLPSSHKGSGGVRSFIFGRDDSNSRSLISISEDSSDTASKENGPTRRFTAKFSNTQARSSSQVGHTSEKASATSLFEILKRSSAQSGACNQETTVGLTQTVFDAFKIPKKPMKIDGRS